MPGRDTRTRWQGVFARHRTACPVNELPAGVSLSAIARVCACTPSYYGKVYERPGKRYVSTRRFATSAAARGARKELLDRVLDGGLLGALSEPTLGVAHADFVAAAREGRALNKHGRSYKASALADIDDCLRNHVLPDLGGRRLGEVRPADVQRLVDRLAPRLSGSRVRSVVNALRSLYRWAEGRELVEGDPASRVRLPAMDATPRERIASPAEFAMLLAALEPDDALPYALACYAMGRRAQIQRLRWADVDVSTGLIEWGIDPDARKSASARRVVPVVFPLLVLLQERRRAVGDPGEQELVCPPRRAGGGRLLHTGGLASRAERAWRARGLEPIGLHECRHTIATWLDAAGVSPKVASVLMGHATPERQPGAAQITLARYTHVMPDATEDARRVLNTWLQNQLRASGSRR